MNSILSHLNSDQAWAYAQLHTALSVTLHHYLTLTHTSSLSVQFAAVMVQSAPPSSPLTICTCEITTLEPLVRGLPTNTPIHIPSYSYMRTTTHSITPVHMLAKLLHGSHVHNWAWDVCYMCHVWVIFVPLVPLAAPELL